MVCMINKVVQSDRVIDQVEILQFTDSFFLRLPKINKRNYHIRKMSSHTKRSLFKRQANTSEEPECEDPMMIMSPKTYSMS